MRSSPAAFTLIELLVVIAIIGIVAGLSIPAVQSARESSRRTYCTSQLSQLAKGIIHYEAQHRHFPSGGWGKDWLGSAGATGRSQPSGWVYTVLPFVEEQAMYDSISAATGTAGYVKLCEQTGAVFTCPTRRSPKARPVTNANFKTQFGPVNDLEAAAKTDYCLNGGSIGRCAPAHEYVEQLPAILLSSGNKSVTACCRQSGSPSTKPNVPIQQFLKGAGHGGASHENDQLGACDDCEGAIDDDAMSPSSYADGSSLDWQGVAGIAHTFDTDYGLPSLGNGMGHRMSQVMAGHVFDGLSNVYLVGEKHINETKYEYEVAAGADPGDAQPMLVGFSSSTIRWASELPLQDNEDTDKDHPNIFGSAHPGVFNMALGDGSVRSISLEIDKDTHKNLAARSPREDGEVLGAF